MKKTLLLLRHAKSSWADPSRADHDRTLNSRGEKAAPVMGRFLRLNDLIPDLVWCSTAERAVQTLALLGKEFAAFGDGVQGIHGTDGGNNLRREADIIYSGDVYMAGEQTLLNCLRQTHDDAETVMMVGHNPGLETFATHLYGTGDADAFEDMKRKFPTSGLCQYEFDVDRWADINWKSGRLVRFVRVKALHADGRPKEDAV